jgi:hypothetical protein
VAVFQLHAHTRILQSLKCRATHVVAEAIPELQPVERNVRRVFLVTQGVDRHSPDHRAVFSEHMETQRTAVNRRRAEDTHVQQFAVVRLAVIKELFSQQTVKPG